MMTDLRPSLGRSRGRVLLLAVLQTRTASTVAAAVDVHHSTISRLASGRQTTDSYRLRVALERKFGIPASAWDEPA